MSAAVATGSERTFFGHPAGLSTLFLHRVLGAVLLLRSAGAAGRPSDPGLGMSTSTASAYGTYVALVYLFPLLWITRPRLGYRRAVLVGGMACAMAMPTEIALAGLVADRLGDGPAETEHLRDGRRVVPRSQQPSGTPASRICMGINLGAFVAPLVTGYLMDGPRVALGLRRGGHRHDGGRHPVRRRRPQDPGRIGLTSAPTRPARRRSATCSRSSAPRSAASWS